MSNSQRSISPLAGTIGLVALAVGLLILLGLSLADLEITRWLFVHTTYYCLMVATLCWVGVHLQRAERWRRETLLTWLRENWPGLLLALAVTAVVAFAVEPALRVLSDEANLVGTSKNLFTSKTATFTVSGKNYYGSYWDIDVSIDRRPTLFPFLVSLIHTVCGYSYKNAFLLNLLVLPVFLLVAYRLAKSLGGETFALVTTLLVAAHPSTLMSVRSGGFDFLAAFFGLLIIKSLLDFFRDQQPARLAALWLNLCLFAEIRYESALFIPVVIASLLLFKMVTWSSLRPFAFIYVLSPAILLPRVWQSMLRGNVPEQEPGTVTFSARNFLDNAYEYFQPVLDPAHSYPAHSALLIALGVVGGLAGLRWVLERVRARDWTSPELRFAIVVAAWMLLQIVIVFSYVWGRAQYPSAARLVIPVDTFFSFAAAWLLTRALARWRPYVAILVATAMLAMQVPVAAQARMLNRLTQTRESAATWRFFEDLPSKDILIVTDRPNHFTIMGYGAMSFESAQRDPYLLTAFARHLFRDVYLIQQIKLSTGAPLAGYDLWPDRKLDTVLEFQNDADVLVRVSRLAR